MLIWNETFATGSELVDLQHRRLIENINKLEELLYAPQVSPLECGELFTFLEHYVNTHFKLEEMCMERHRCPAHAQNMSEHREFQDVFAQFKRRYLAGDSGLQMLREFLVVANDWIKHHILTVDIQLKGLTDGCQPHHSLNHNHNQP